jgi:GT2 family glycosyltransferase
MWAEPKIDVRIPFEPLGRLGEDYNRIMEESRQEWVLFKDHDLLIFHPNWYLICQQAIKRYPDSGIFTIFTNNIGCRKQRLRRAPLPGRSMLQHKNFAKKIWHKNGYSISEIKGCLISGFFMLTSKTAWKMAGKFRGTGLFGEDTEYHRKITRAGLKCRRLDGLYALHVRDRADGTWIKHVKTAKEYWAEYYSDHQRKKNEKSSLHGDHR